MKRTLLALALSLLLAAPSPAAAPPKPAAPRKVVLLGLDGADWSLLDPLVKAGKMPELARILSEGRSAQLDSELPFLSPILWTTIATGVPPAEHGVLDFEEFDPADGSRVPVSARSREFPALWSTASARGLDVGLVGWWASWPCEKLRGFCVSDRFAPALFNVAPEGAGLVFPQSQWKNLEKIRSEELGRVEGDFRKVYGTDPSAARALGPTAAKAVEGLERVLVQTRVFARAGLTLGERVHPALLALYLEGTDEVGHIAVRWHPPKMAEVSDAEFRAFSGAIEGFYRETDRILGEVAAFARKEGAILVIASDHGFRWGSDRPALSNSDAWNTAAYWHRQEGILVVSGAGAAKGSARLRGNVYDVAPTVSALLGLPVDRRMKGKVLRELLEPSAVQKSETKDLRKEIAVSLVPIETPSDSSRREAEAQREKLKSLGYLTGAETGRGAVPTGGRPGRTEGAWNNLGLQLREKGARKEAEAAFRKALEINPAYASPLNNLSFLLLSEKRWDEADEALFRSVEKGNPRSEALFQSRIAEYGKKGTPPGRRVKFLSTAAKRFPGSRVVALAEGRRLYEAKDCAGSATVFDAWLAAKGDDPEILNYAAVSRLCSGDRDGAVDRFRRSLAKDPRQSIPQEALRQLGASP